MMIKVVSLIQEKRSIIAFFAVYICFCLIMDVRLYYRVQDYSVRPIKDSLDYQSNVPCDLNPFCVVTVKGLMLDYLNFYVFSPLAALVDRIFGLSKWEWLSPNHISFFHVLVAILAGKLISSKSLSQRKLGVLVFQIRSWLDDLDGLIARKRKHIGGEHSDVGSTGYFVDAICDSLGSVALLIGIFFCLKNTLARRGGYIRLQPLVPSITEGPIGSCVVHKKKMTSKNVLPSVVLITGSLVASSLAWNRYIDLYQNLLEGNYKNRAISHEDFYNRQTVVIRSIFFWIITTSWRLINPHALTDYLLIAVFVDRLWEYIQSARWISYIVIFILIYLSDFHYIQNYRFIWNIESTVSADNFYVNSNNSLVL
ncbi:ceramide phosphoethanolamine synthase [Chelonus insularis]|uniref:ceramide phosphoethanolamine synthase n=1 Tax=Chelonus insularis TaxID=460826 RepID=UPI00158C3F9F|nr:ceramide phosphoethanolamine synthase [Chelonus insularis]